MYLLTLDWSLSMRHNVPIVWKKHTHSSSAGIYQSQQWSLHSTSTQEAAPGAATFMLLQDPWMRPVFVVGGWVEGGGVHSYSDCATLSEQKLVPSHSSSALWPRSRPAPGEALPWCTCRRFTWTSASSRAPHGNKVIIIVHAAVVVDLCVWTLLQRLIF